MEYLRENKSFQNKVERPLTEISSIEVGMAKHSCEVLHKALHRTPERLFLFFKILRNQWLTVLCFSFWKDLQDSWFTFKSSFFWDSCCTWASCIFCFKHVSDDEIHMIITTSTTEFCLLDPWHIFLVKECLDILLPSITRLVNCSPFESVLQDGLKIVLVTPMIKQGQNYFWSTCVCCKSNRMINGAERMKVWL